MDEGGESGTQWSDEWGMREHHLCGGTEGSGALVFQNEDFEFLPEAIIPSFEREREY
jgi:hypothetical protein